MNNKLSLQLEARTNPLQSGEYVRPFDKQHMLNLRNFSWSNPVVVRQAQESEFDSESSDEDHMDTTHGSSKVEQKSPKDVLKAIIESDNRSEAKYPRPSLQLSSQVKIEKPLQEKNSTKLKKV